MTPEKRVQNACLDYLKKLADKGLPIMYERRQAGGFSYKMGAADVWFTIGGIHFELEIKAPGKSLRPMQEKWRDICESRGIMCMCIDNIETFEEFVDKLIKETI